MRHKLLNICFFFYLMDNVCSRHIIEGDKIILVKIFNFVSNTSMDLKNCLMNQLSIEILVRC